MEGVEGLDTAWPSPGDPDATAFPGGVLVAVCPDEAQAVLAVSKRGSCGRATFRVLPDSLGLAYRLLPALGLDEVPVLQDHGWQRRLALSVKHAGDLVAAALLLIALLPLLAVVGATVKMASPGPVLFTQDRVGRNGRVFRILKIRTMVAGAEGGEEDVAERCGADLRFVKIDCDPRVTRLGRLLRRTSIDELPQLWNVIRGDMSLVGPRPSQPREVDHYEASHFERLLVRPGITGMWQVSGRSELCFEEAVELDKAYVRRWNLWLDLKILAKTVLVVLQCRGAC